MDNIRSMEWVAGRLGEKGSEPIVIVDCRFVLGQPEAGRVAYEAGHLPGAIYMDLDRDLSAPVTEHGGRHPLPDWDVFAAKLGGAGISRDHAVVAYDDQGGAMASRFWWMLRYLGHQQVFVMDRGFSAWKAAGYPVSTAVDDLKAPVVADNSFSATTGETTSTLGEDSTSNTSVQRKSAIFEAIPQPHMVVSMAEVRAKLGNPQVAIVDSREHRRYLGLEEPIDKAAGHIPGARNSFWKESLAADGSWRSANEQRSRFASLRGQQVSRPASHHDEQDSRAASHHDEQEIIVYCGSGVTACPNVLALEEAGFRNVRLYAGSWSDWISYPENQIATWEE